MQIERKMIKGMSNDQVTQEVGLLKIKNIFHIANAMNGDAYQTITTQCEMSCNTLMTLMIAAMQKRKDIMDDCKENMKNITDEIYRMADDLFNMPTDKELN